MANLFAELKRRHIYRVAAAYAVVAWVLLQLFNNMEPMLKLPDWAGTFVLVLLLGGFPFALIFAWIHQLTTADGAPAQANHGAVDWMLAGALAVVIALIVYEQTATGSRSGTAQRQANVASATAPAPSGISIAVLPFLNLSRDPDQEFFSDGMTEEITAALAKVPNLRVVGRTSAFQFKGQNGDLRAIGQALGAGHLLEGSVRKDGNQLRITAQLIKADDGTHVWTESYDRELTGVFAVQEDIAQAIAGALRVPLGLKQGESLVPSRTAKLESYQDYLRAKALVRVRGLREPGGPLTEAAKLLEQVVARDPDYAPAWALLGQAYSLIAPLASTYFSGSVEGLRRIEEESLSKAETAAQRAIRLDPNNADAYAALALVQALRGKFIQSEDLFNQALALDPGDPEALNSYSIQLASAGRLRDSLPLRQRLQALEPFVPVFNVFTAEILWLNGQNDAAIAMVKALPPNPVFGAYILAEIYAAAGRYGEAADALQMAPFLPGIVETAARLLRTAPAKAAGPQGLPRLGVLGFVYLYIGAPERALDPPEDFLAAGVWNAVATFYLWHSSASPVRKTERFKAYLRNAGFVAYWRERGWPDLCRPVGAADFVCD
jgi:TolB-like protein